MASIKKHSKRLLEDIQEAANSLELVSSNLDLLEEIHELALDLKTNITALNRQLAGLKKAEFAAALAKSEVMEILDELVDQDPISALEQRLFTALPDQASNEAGEYFQQLLDKIEKLYTPLLTAIQQLTAIQEDF